ncbi:MAG: sensor histidine kinase, partial [Candidatus Binatia bacterium]
SFTYSVSHDLRAPLRGIDGWSLALLEDYGDQLDVNGCEYLGVIRSETQRMGQLIDDLLQLSRVSRAELKREPVDLSAIARVVATRLQQAEPERTIDFFIEPDMTAQGDAHLLEIVLTNLLGNACKFTGSRAIAQIEFCRSVEQDPQTKLPVAMFMVRDNGVGFDMAHAQKLFGAFQRMHRSSEFPGTGIGLATVQRIVHRHQGKIEGNAELGQGATFTFTLGETT